jgi:hypothetical protein
VLLLQAIIREQTERIRRLEAEKEDILQGQAVAGPAGGGATAGAPEEPSPNNATASAAAAGVQLHTGAAPDRANAGPEEGKPAGQVGNAPILAAAGTSRRSRGRLRRQEPQRGGDGGLIVSAALARARTAAAPAPLAVRGRGSGKRGRVLTTAARGRSAQGWLPAGERHKQGEAGGSNSRFKRERSYLAGGLADAAALSPRTSAQKAQDRCAWHCLSQGLQAVLCFGVATNS